MALKANALTYLARVKRREWGNEPSKGDAFDTLLEDLINEESDRIERKVGRTIKETAHTEYLDGNGSAYLRLRQGPLVSVTSVHSVEVSDSGDGTPSYTLTELYPYQYIELGTRVTGWPGLAALERRDGGVFTRGTANWKVIYTAGWPAFTEGSETIYAPEFLINWATYCVTRLFALREVAGMHAKAVGETQWSPITDRQFHEAEERALAPLFAGIV